MRGVRDAHVSIWKDLRDRLKAVAAREGRPVVDIVEEALEARVGRSSHNYNFPPHIRNKLPLHDWQRRVRDFIEPLSAVEAFNVPTLMHRLGVSVELFPSQGDRLLIAGIVQKYVETLPGVYPGPEVPGKPFNRRYYLSRDAADLAHGETLLDAEG